jgi:hypothetical protein
MSERKSAPKPPRTPNYRLRQAIAGTAFVAVSGAGLFAGLNALDHNSEKSWDKTEQEALQETKHAWNNVVVLHEGATVRTSPIAVQEKAESRDNIAYRIGKDQVLRIDQPLVYSEAHPNGAPDTVWLGHTGFGKDTADSDNIYWVNFTELQKQNTDSRTYVEIYNYPDAADQPVLDIHTENGLFTHPDGEVSGQLGIATPMSEEIFTRTAAQAGLTPNHSK